MFILGRTFTPQRFLMNEAGADGADGGGGDTTLTAADTPPADTPPADTPPADDTGNEGDADGDTDEEGDQTGAPETYEEFTLPEGVQLDSALLEKVTPLFKEQGFTQAQAQSLVSLQAEMQATTAQADQDAFAQMKDDWRDQSKSDKDLGGDNFDQNVALAVTALDKFGTPELRKALDDSGMGNHPEVLRFMYKVGKLTQEDSPGADNNAGAQQGDRLKRLYPDD